MRLLRTGIGCVILLLCLQARAAELPCDDIHHPQICAFLNRYITQLQTWSEPNISVYQKMHDDKFVILSGSVEALNACTDTTAFALQRYENKAYEVIWSNGSDTLLHAAFPIQYELILGKTQKEMEQMMPSLITSAPRRRYALDPSDVQAERISPTVYRSTPVQYYETPSLNACVYLAQDADGQRRLIDDADQPEYTVANLFQDGLGREYTIQVSQSLYGMQKRQYTVSLQQWLDYCAAEQMTCYVAIEEQREEAVQVLVVAQNTDLAYNHILSVIIPRSVLSERKGLLAAKLSAFIPTHNISNLFEQYTDKPKKQRTWQKD